MTCALKSTPTRPYLRLYKISSVPALIVLIGNQGCALAQEELMQKKYLLLKDMKWKT